MKDILIVEDGKTERERLERILKAAKYSVIACSSVGEAERYLEYESFRLGILDVGLSDKSGSYLFNAVKKGGKIAYIIIFTGNPSVHLKQRFLDDGAADYIVKGSPQAQNENLLKRVDEIIGLPQQQPIEGIPLDDFLRKFVPETSRKLFLDMDNAFPKCKGCGANSYVVTFANSPQLPPEITGVVQCSSCGQPMDPDVE